MTWKPLVALSFALSTAAFAQAPQPLHPVLQFTVEGVKASGLTPGGPVVWWSVWHEVVEYSARYSRREAFDGADRRPLGASPAAPTKMGERDLWFVVDPYAMTISVQRGGVAQ